ncbi:Serine/threonine-protein kinase ATG1a, partial [Linum perenne]
DRIYLILEYCDGGDLAQYIHRHGKVSELVARHFMKQLGSLFYSAYIWSGLQVLQEKHLIHRDLKPQNLLLSSDEETPQLKIGDFGFARSLNPDDMADTLCGSPLYMAPEIIQNRKYDAKADLWSVGAILFQLVTGRPPFQGNSQFQLFQNILRSTELQFPEGALEKLHPNFVDLCRSLLRHNPVERLNFQEFFSHKFFEEPRLIADVEQSSLLPLSKLVAYQSHCSHDEILQVHPEHLICSGMSNLKLEVPSALYNERKLGKDGGTSSNQTMFQCREDVTSDNNLSIDQQPQVADCLESIEKDYVLVYRHVTSTENISYYLATSLQENSNVRVSVCGSTEKDENSLAIAIPANKNPEVQESDLLKTQCNFGTSKELQGLSTLHPSTRLLLLRQYLQAVSEVVDEKYKAGQYQEAFSVELVVLAAWKKAVEICGSWLASTPANESPESSAVHALPRPDKTDFDGPSSACKWAEQGFIYALDHAEKLSGHLRDLDAKAEMPDAMEIIFQKALALGTGGAVDEYMGNKENAAVSYSKALLLFSFIVGEATSLALSPPFILTPGNRQRICSYMMNLQTHQSKFSI